MVRALHRGDESDAFEERVEVVFVGHSICGEGKELACRRWLTPRAGQLALEEQPSWVFEHAESKRSFLSHNAIVRKP